MRPKTLYSMMGAVALAIAVIASSAAAQGHPPGGEEEAGNNLSIPAVFVPNADGGPALRVPCGTYAVPGADGEPPSDVYPGYWLQKTEATWSADCATAASAEVIADWGDNLTSSPTLRPGKPIRVELSLLDLTATGMGGFVITNLTPDLEDRLATYGTRGAPDDAFATGDEGAPATRVFDTGATLKIEKLVNGTPTEVIFEGPMTAEINSIGAVVYGYNWGTKGKPNAPTEGIYRLTFTTVATTIVGIADTAALRVPSWNATSTTLTVELTTGAPSADTTPDPFAFTDVVDAPINTMMTSNAIVVSGINALAPISVTAGEYEINASGTWTSAAGTVANGDSVRVRRLSSPSYSTTVEATLTIGGVSDTFSITTGQAGTAIQVTRPTAGMVWPAGSTQTIRWTYTGNPGLMVRIELRAGGVVKAVIGYTSTAAGAYNWKIPATQTPGSYRIRVTSMTDDAYSDGSGLFTIAAAAPSGLDVLNPDGGESWAVGTTHVIRWASTGDPGPIVKVQLLKGGAVVRLVGFAATSAAQYSWQIPLLPAGADYQVRVTSITNTAYTDTGGAFTIRR